MVPRVRDTGRSSGDKVPLVAPYNFGINVDWYEEYKMTNRKWLSDWFKHPDLPGFGLNQREGSPMPSGSGSG